LEGTSQAKTLLNKVINNTANSGKYFEKRSSVSKSRSPSLERFNKLPKKINVVNLAPQRSMTKLNQVEAETIKFEPEFLGETNSLKKGKTEEKKALIENVKEKILKRSAKPKSIVRNYGIRDDNDPNAIKKVYDN
jgi:hypothetical protein